MVPGSDHDFPALVKGSVMTVTVPTLAHPVLVGHRGAAGTAPENTVAAFRQGVASGADFIEIDVQLSADGVPFVFHDDTPARTTDAAVVFPGREADLITSFTWAELQQLDTGASFDERYAGERIPHLDDVAAVVAGTGVGVYVEVKSPWNSPAIGEVLAENLRTRPAWARLVSAGELQVICFDGSFTRAFAALVPEVPVQQLTIMVPAPQVLADWAEYVASVGVHHRTVTAQDVAAVHAAGLALSVYTPNSAEDVRAVLDLGVDAVTTDFPAEHRRLVHGTPTAAAGAPVGRSFVSR